MKHHNVKRREYTAPRAEVIYLVPDAPIASWVWKPDAGKDWTINGWGLDVLTQTENASVTGVTSWLDELGHDPDLN